MGQEVDFEPQEPEKWNVYMLEDGTKIRLKAVASSVVRLDEYLPNGEPIYIINSTPIVAADVPDNLKKTAG